MPLSDNAIRLWLAHFLGPRNTLRFGGDFAQMEITPEGRDALDELIAADAVRPIEPDDSHPNREHYGSGPVDLRDELKARPHLNPFADAGSFVTFRRKADAPEIEAPQRRVEITMRGETL